VRQPERDARQERRAHAAAADGRGALIRLLTPDDLALVDAHLPLNRLGAGGDYLVAWDGGTPVGHAHLAWAGTELGVPELQDVFVAPDRRRQGIATALTRAAERLVAERGHERCSLSVGVGNTAARALYARLGYTDAGVPPKRVRGTILLRGVPLEVDDTLLYLVRRVAVDSEPARSS
jgi:ribosomal protein S18 acetylase RimI-like enzyme